MGTLHVLYGIASLVQPAEFVAVCIAAEHLLKGDLRVLLGDPDEAGPQRERAGQHPRSRQDQQTLHHREIRREKVGN
jgi:hypothetical protein